MIELTPSILSADFARPGAEVQAAVEGGATLLHVDIMDGHFVPNITIGPPVVASLRKVCRVPLDCHLMIERPDEFIPEFAKAGADWISAHQEPLPGDCQGCPQRRLRNYEGCHGRPVCFWQAK